MLEIFKYSDSLVDLFFARFISKNATAPASDVIICRLKRVLTEDGDTDVFVGLLKSVWQRDEELLLPRSVGALLRLSGLAPDAVSTLQIIEKLDRRREFDSALVGGMGPTSSQLRAILQHILAHRRYHGALDAHFGTTYDFFGVP
jgi:hypothetical protein